MLWRKLSRWQKLVGSQSLKAFIHKSGSIFTSTTNYSISKWIMAQLRDLELRKWIVALKPHNIQLWLRVEGPFPSPSLVLPPQVTFCSCVLHASHWALCLPNMWRMKVACSIGQNASFPTIKLDWHVDTLFPRCFQQILWVQFRGALGYGLLSHACLSCCYWRA